MINHQRLDQDDIVIPTFDPNLGTLHQAVIDIVMLGGTTSNAGVHSHGSYVLTSQNTVSSNTFLSGGFATFSLASTPSGASSHSFSSPDYSFGNIDVGSFTETTTIGPSHTQSLQVSSAGSQQVGSTSYRWRAQISSGSAGVHTHEYAGQGRSLVFTNSAQLNTLTRRSDIVIPAAGFDTDVSSSHNHGVSTFSVVVNTSQGPRDFTFGNSSTPTASGHTHSIDPRFHINARYTFTAVPEPSCSILLILGIAAVNSRRMRRRAIAAHEF